MTRSNTTNAWISTLLGVTVGKDGTIAPTVFPEVNTTYLSNITTENSTTFLDPDDDNGSCSDWVGTQHTIFQLANLCMLISFLTPSNFRHHFFFLRLMINFGFLLMTVWASLFICMLDILIWNAVFLLINSAYLIYLGYKIIPEKFSKTLEDIYTHTFKPLKVTRKQFKDMTDFGTMVLLPKGAVYAQEGVHTTGRQLSILLKGRLKVTYDDVYLHSVDVNQFVDSSEYDCVSETDTEQTFQVTISASEDSLLFTLPYKRLQSHLATNPVLAHIFQQVIGKDISQKLYEIQERQMAKLSYLSNGRRSSMVNVRHSLVSSSTTNLANLNCLKGCMIQNEQPSNQSSLGTYETSV